MIALRDRRVPIIHGLSALESIRRRGVSLVDAIREAVDNSVDWGARRIHIHLEKDDSGFMHVWIVDDALGIVEWIRIDSENGIGIPVGSEEEADFEGLQHAMRMGGRILRPRRNPNGRFGHGMPQTAISLQGVMRVYTRVAGGEWRHLSLSLDKLRDPASRDAQTGHLLQEQIEMVAPRDEDIPPGWEFGESGTLVVLGSIPKQFHRVAYMGSFVKNLKEELGRTYRYPISNGLQIIITTPEDCELEPILPRDPLCELEGSVESEMFGPVESFGEQSIVFDGHGGRPVIIDPSTGDHAVVTMRFVRIEPKIVYEKLGVPLDTKPKGMAAYSRKFAKWELNNDGQGFSLVRGDREIGHAEDFGLFTRRNQLRYFKGEIRFPPIPLIDRFFGIEPNKSKHRISNRMVQWMQPARSTIQAIVNATVKAHKNLNPKPPSRYKPRSEMTSGEREGKVSISEKVESVSTALEEVAPPIQSAESDVELKKARLAIEEGDFEELELQHTKFIENAERSVERAHDSGSEVEVREAEEVLAGLKEGFEQAKAELERRFESPAYFRTHERDLTNDDLYQAVNTDQGLRIKLNRRTPFYIHAYAPARAKTEEEDGDSRPWLAMEMMLNSVAYADADALNSTDKKAFWNRVRPLIGRTTSMMISILDELEEEEEVEDVRTKWDVAESISELLDIEKPERIKGSSIPKKFILHVIEALGGTYKQTIGKHAAYRSACQLFEPEIDPEPHFSTGGTVVLSGWIALEEAIADTLPVSE